MVAYLVLPLEFLLHDWRFHQKLLIFKELSKLNFFVVFMGLALLQLYGRIL